MPLLTLRLELELALEPATLRLELDPATLRLLLLPATLRLALDPATLRLLEEAATLRPSPDVLFTDLDATLDAGVTERLALDPNEALRFEVLRLRFLSHPPPFTLRLGLKSATLPPPGPGAG